MADGSTKPIETIQRGDKVRAAFHEDPEGDISDGEVVEVYHNDPRRLVEVEIDGQVIRATPTHPFYVRGRGWTAAGELRPHDELRTASGKWTTAGSVVKDGRVEPVYNFHVAGLHTYFVRSGSGREVLVHNDSGGTKTAAKKEVEVKINGWDIYPRSKRVDILKFGTEQVTPEQLTSIIASGRVKVLIDFDRLSGLSDEEMKKRFEWLATIIRDGLKARGAPLAAEHFWYWTRGHGNGPRAPKLSPGVFKNTPEYKALIKELIAKAKSKPTLPCTGDKYVRFKDEQSTEIKFLMGDYTYNWEIQRDKHGYFANIKVDDEYIFRTAEEGADAWLDETLVIPFLGKNYTLIVSISIPDRVNIQLQKVLGATDFDRIIEWTERLPTN